MEIEFSHPAWLVKRYLARFGFDETAALLAANNQIAPLALRVNTLNTTRAAVLERLKAQNLAARAGNWSPDAIIIENAGDPTDWALWREGHVIAQDEAAQLVAQSAAPRAGEIVIDAASAPGGKATHLAQLMENRGRIVACELAPGRLKLIEENAARLGISILETRSGDFRLLAAQLATELPEGASLVLLDAPCSGTGTFRRRPDARWRKTPAQLSELVELQAQLLHAAASLVRPGGAMVYATCSLESEENEEQIAVFLASQRGFRVEAPGRDFRPELVTPGGFLQAFPHRHGCDGMFAAKLRREG